MTTHWVSQERHFCKYCKCWLSGNKNSIARHEKGRNHNENVRVWYLRKREDRFQEQKEKREADKAMRDIEKAAQAALSEDIAAIAGGTFGASTKRNIFVPQSQLQAQLAQAPAIPGAPTSSTAPKYYRSEFQKGQPEEEPSLEKKVDLKDDPFAGQYIVKGKIYIEARYHEDKLVRGVRCEVWSDTDEEWKAVTIDSVYEFAVPNTDLAIRQYTVKDTDETFEYARADKLRFVPALPPEDLPPEEGEEDKDEADEADDDADVPDLPQPLATGYGAWTYVANPSQPLPPPPAPPNTLIQSDAPIGADIVDTSTDAFTAYNPYGGAYKGVNVEDDNDTATLGQLNDLLPTEKVSFKKRKASKSKRKKKRSKRRRDDSDK